MGVRHRGHGRPRGGGDPALQAGVGDGEVDFRREVGVVGGEGHEMVLHRCKVEARRPVARPGAHAAATLRT